MSRINGSTCFNVSLTGAFIGMLVACLLIGIFREMQPLFYHSKGQPAPVAAAGVLVATQADTVSETPNLDALIEEYAEPELAPPAPKTIDDLPDVFVAIPPRYEDLFWRRR